MIMLKFTDTVGKPMWVNREKIVAVFDDDTKTKIVVMDSNACTVAETISEVIDIIRRPPQLSGKYRGT